MSKISITCISDTHNDHGELDLASGDILIHAGDACTKGNYTEGLSFLYWFVRQPFKYKILVPGNHDKKLKSHPELLQLAHDLGIKLLMDDYVEVEGLRIYGNCRTFMDEKRQLDFDKREKAWKNIPKDLDLLITHMPPKGILDKNMEGTPIGCSKLLEKVLEVKPKLHVFGHCHEYRDLIVTNEDTEFRNVAVKNRSYLTTHYRGYRIQL